MMSVLYNFVKVDTDTFLSIPKYIEIVISMCKAVSSFCLSFCSCEAISSLENLSLAF